MKWKNNIELNLVFFAILLNFAWEIQQMPLFDVPGSVSVQQAIWGCTQATFGDALILLLAYWIVAIGVQSRLWLFSHSNFNLLMFIVVGLSATTLIESLSTGVLNRWQYADAMPTLPILGTGLLPVLQWILLPPWILWLTRRQLISVVPHK